MKRSQLGEVNNNILKYLNNEDKYYSPTEVARAVGGLTLLGFPKCSSWASPKLIKLVRWGFVERNSKGHYKAIVA
jgi:hypothetical protein